MTIENRAEQIFNKKTEKDLGGSYNLLDYTGHIGIRNKIMSACPCCSTLEYSDCCGPIIEGEMIAKTPEQVMRSRYTAYVKAEIDYLEKSTHPDGMADFDKEATRSWAEDSQWKRLEIISSKGGGPDEGEGSVEFIAHFEQKGVEHKHHELAMFKKEGDQWLFLDGSPVKPKPMRNESPKIGRNDPCPCGSGKKYKKCCA